MITVRTPHGSEFARDEAMRRLGKDVHISLVLFVKDDPTMRDYVFRTVMR